MKIKNKERARLALAELEKEMELLTKEEMNACKGGLDDIIVLFDTNAVSGCGHTAVLIGDDINGWKYYSSNGAVGGGFSGKEEFEYREFDTLQQFHNHNNNGEFKGGYIYDKSVRIETTPEEDEIARRMAYHKITDGYHLLNNSCLDTSREVVNAILRNRGFKTEGDGYDIPNKYRKFLENKGY